MILKGICIMLKYNTTCHIKLQQRKNELSHQFVE